MAEKSMLWSAPTSGDGANAYTEAETVRLFGSIIGDAPASEGVLYGVLGELAPSGVASPISVADGVAFVNGYFYWNTNPENVVVPTPSIGTTGHRIVLQWIAASKTVRIALLSSSDGVASLPAITQTAGVQWEIVIANLTITTGGVITLTDARAFCHYATKVSTGMLDDGAVTAVKMADGAALAEILDDDGPGSGLDADTLDGQHYSNFSGKLVTNGDSHDHNGGDGAQIPTGGIQDLAVTLAKLANDAADYDKVGNRVMKLYGRQGGDSQQWSSTGSTNYTPNALKIQAGAIQLTIQSGQNQSDPDSVTFPSAYPAFHYPLVFLTPFTSEKVAVRVSGVGNSSFNLYAWLSNGGTVGAQKTIPVFWVAIGDE
jgi:hypothetical protein